MRTRRHHAAGADEGQDAAARAAGVRERQHHQHRASARLLRDDCQLARRARHGRPHRGGDARSGVGRGRAAARFGATGRSGGSRRPPRTAAQTPRRNDRAARCRLARTGAVASRAAQRCDRPRRSPRRSRRRSRSMPPSAPARSTIRPISVASRISCRRRSTAAPRRAPPTRSPRSSTAAASRWPSTVTRHVALAHVHVPGRGLRDRARPAGRHHQAPDVSRAGGRVAARRDRSR